MKRISIWLTSLIALLAAVICVRAWSIAAPQLDAALEPAPLGVEIDRDAALARFQAAIRIPTVSFGSEAPSPRDAAEFLAFHDFLSTSFPGVHVSSSREVVSDFTLLYRFAGSEPALAPALLMGHMDVVPVDPASASDWKHPPFSAEIADGYVWGRGTIDDKINVMGLLEAAELLVASGWQPKRTILFSFGHDEEVGGEEGAGAVGKLLEARGWKPALAVDEGGAIATKGVLPGLDRPLAAVGVAEKGFMSLELKVETEGGHSSSPPKETAIGILAAAVLKLEHAPLPSHSGGPLAQTLGAAAPHMGFPARAVLANLWLFRPLVERVLLEIPIAAPLIRTTTATTIFQAGVKENVLPSTARAVVNFRLFPGDTRESVTEHVRAAIADPRVQISLSGRYREASFISNTDSDAYRVLTDTIRESFPDAIIGPFLTPGGTDQRHIRHLTRDTYGFMPVSAPAEEIRLAHGVNERIRVDAYLDGIRFYARLLKRVGDWH